MKGDGESIKIIKIISLTLLIVTILAISSVPTNTYGKPSLQSVPQYGSPQVIATNQSFPIQIAVGSDGTVYWENQHPFGNGTLMKLAPGATTPTEILGGLSYAEGMGIDAAGNVYYDEYMEGILYKLPAGSSTPQVLATGLNYPNFMSVDAAGDVYMITGQTCGNNIVEYHAATGTVSSILTVPQLDGVFIHPSGDLYFVTCNDQQIERLALGSSTPQVIFTWTGSSKPEGIAVDAFGNVYFTTYGESVQVLSAGTTTPIVLASVSSFTDGYAQQMALDSSGNVYFVDSYQGDVWKIPISISLTTPTLANSQFQTATMSSSMLESSPIGSWIQYSLDSVVVLASILAVFMILRRPRVKIDRAAQSSTPAGVDASISQTQTPTCRICGKPMKLLDKDNQKWYCYKDDQVWLGKEQKWKEQELAQVEQQAQTVKYCKKCGNMLELEDEFCDKCGSRQKKILATATTDGQQTTFDKRQIRPTELWYLAPFFFGIIGGLVGYVAVKEDDKKMAENLLIFGIVMTVLLFIATLALFSSLIYR